MRILPAIVCALIALLSAAARLEAQNIAPAVIVRMTEGTAAAGMLPQGIDAEAARIGATAELLFPAGASMKKTTGFPGGFVLVRLQPGSDAAAAAKEFETLPGVAYAEPNHIYRVDAVPNDPEYPRQWGARRVGLERAWDVTRGEAGIIVGVIDTGIDYDHEDLRDQHWINGPEDMNGDGHFQPWPVDELRDGVAGDFDGVDNDGNGVVDDVIGYDFVVQPGAENSAGGDHDVIDPVPLDEMGHGSSVSGIIGARADNGLGVAGLAPGCRIMSLRAFDARGFGTEADVARAIAYAVANGAAVLNMSFGDVTYSRVLRDMVRYAYGRGVVMVASSGNSGVSTLHYPSAYDETISVSATASNNVLAGFSNYGATIDITAPGLDIRTTGKDNDYVDFSGTSASAPFVTAAAALVIGLQPALTPEEVRGLLLASAEDVGTEGWDSRYGAGMLRADRAVQLKYPSEVRILTPRTDFTSSGQSVLVTGTAASPRMTGYTLQYGVGPDPRNWATIVEYTAGHAVAETLAVWDVSHIPDSTYTLRLSAESNTGATMEDRVVMHIDRTRPVFVGVGFVPAVDGDSYGIAAGFVTDDRTLGRVFYRQKGSALDWEWVSAEGETENNLFISSIHNVFIGKGKLLPGRTYEFYFSAENEAGLISQARDGARNFELTIPLPVPDAGFLRKPYSLPLARLFQPPADLDGSGTNELYINDYSEDGRFRALEFAGGSFTDASSGAQRNQFPRATGDVTGDGSPELLTSFVRGGYLYGGGSGFPSSLLWADTVGGDFWPVTIADVNDDGRQEVLAIVDDSTVGVFVYDGDMQRIGSIVNPTRPGPDGVNRFSAPRAAVGDFNRNGRTDLLFGDSDGDFFIVETRGGGDFEVIWGSENDYEDASPYVAAGDFTGDGRKEFAIGFRTGEDDVIPFWFFSVLRLLSDNTAEVMWSQQFHGVTTGAQHGSFTRIDNSLTVGNVDQDPADELVITTYPDLYVIDYKRGPRTFEPVWHYPLANTVSAVIDDLDRNGINDIGFATPDSVVFFEADLPYDGPPVPRSLAVQYSAPQQVQIGWTASGSAQEYRLYKGSTPADMALFGSFPSPISLNDQDIQLGTSYVYAITAYDAARNPQESPPLFSRMLHPHEQPVIDSVLFLQNGQLQVHVSQDMGSVLPRQDRLRLNGSSAPNSIAMLDARTLLLTWDGIPDGIYGLAVRGLRDGEGIPFEDSTFGPFEVHNIARARCYVQEVQYFPPKSFDVRFSLPVDLAEAERPENYTLDPLGIASKASRDAEDPSVVRLTFDGKGPIGALGREYVLIVRNVLCDGGEALEPGAGSTAGVIINRQTLDEMFTYPNPWKAGDGVASLTFANLTPRATIRVFTLSGVFVAEIEEKDGNGGTEWNLLDKRGDPVPGGVYFFHATGTDRNGREVEAKTGKFAIIR